MGNGIEGLRERMGEIPEGRCLIGFSGGADSTAMLLLAAEARDAGRCAPEAIHVNHGLRGAESDGDEAFCRELCRKLGIPLHTARAELDGRRDENVCREERFRVFRKTMEETGIRALVLAHNRDDLTETFLMRLMRGAGSEGLACMSGRDERNGYTVYRPLLQAGREEIRQALRENGQGWREDSLNGDEAYLRNKIRKRLVPLMEEMSAGVSGRIAQTAEILTGENRMAQEMAEAFLTEHCSGGRLDPEALRKAPEALRKRIVRIWWRQQAPVMEEHSLNARQTCEVAALALRERGKVNLPSGLAAVKAKHGIYLTGLPLDVPEAVQYRAPETRFGEIVLVTVPSRGNPGDGRNAQEVPEGFPDGCEIRTRRNGDRIRPFGMTGSRKLQDYLTDRGIDEPMRDRIPLLCRGNEVLLAAGIGAGAVPPWRKDGKNVRLIWQGEMPWGMAQKEE